MKKKIFKMKKIFLHFTDFFLNYTKKPHKLKKAICTFIFTFIKCSNLFLLFKNFKKVHSGVSKRALGPLKITSFARDFKIGPLPILRLPLAHLRLPHEPFLKFSSQQEKIFSSKKGKKTVQISIILVISFHTECAINLFFSFMNCCN